MTTLIRDHGHGTWLGLHTADGLAAYAAPENDGWCCVSEGSGPIVIVADRPAAQAWLEALADRLVSA
jgi:hypothetical protein